LWWDRPVSYREDKMKIPEVKRPSPESLERLNALETKYKGMIAAICPDSGEYFLGRTLVEAVEAARKKYPEKTFYFVRIGSPYAHEHRGGIKKA
jgi:hypothetical protein